MKICSRHIRLFAVLVTFCLCGPAPLCLAQWDPDNGEWGKDDPGHIRVMTWNVYDAMCSTADKQEAKNSWTGMAVIVAGMRPDVLILQETGDLSGDGSRSVDSVADLETTLDLFFNGGLDPFNGYTPVTAYVQKYAPGYTLPYFFVSSETDWYNRNVIVSRFPFTDLNGDTKDNYSDIPYIQSHKYAPGGNGGIRGFMFAEIGLPDSQYSGDLVVGCAHLKAGSGSGNEQQRLEAAQNVAYFIDHWYNGAGTGIPDPYGKIYENPKATDILDENTPVIIGGDWNEDESKNGRDGPALWLKRAEYHENTASDGVDRDGSDSVYDAASHPITGDTHTYGSSSKLDYIAWQDSIAGLSRAFLYHSAGLSNSQQPPEVLNFPNYPYLASDYTSDHTPVIADFALPAPPLACDTSVISAAVGGIASFSMDAGTQNGGRNYFLLGSVTGTSPGFPLPGGQVTLPLNWDVLTGYLLNNANSPALIGFYGTLTGQGLASAQMNTYGPLPPEIVGVTMYFAYLLYYHYDFVSNPVSIYFEP